MARSIVHLIPVPSPGVEVKPLTVRSALSGHFVFPAVPDGLYVLTATRRHYFPASYGQRLPHGHGTPIQVTRDSDFFGELRMHRMGAITGRVLDENGIGLSDVTVVAYRTRLPLRIAASGISDDRGVYRVYGLDPGKYWIRSGPLTLDDGSGFVPTFSPESLESREARAFAVAVDSEVPDADLHIIPGALLHLTVSLQCPVGLSATVFLSSETGRRKATAPCGDSYRFDGLAPGPYEISGEAQDQSVFGFVEMLVHHDEVATLVMVPPPRVNITFQSATGAATTRPAISLFVRRDDLGEIGPEKEIKSPQATLAPGHWEISAHTPPGIYVDSIANPYGGPRRTVRLEKPADAFDLFVELRMLTSIKVTFSDQAASIAGTVQAEGKPVAGIPVFLWPVAEQARRSLHGQLQVLSDVNGEFHFNSLPPGAYRVLATYDLVEADQESMDAASAATVNVELSQTAKAALAPWLAPY